MDFMNNKKIYLDKNYKDDSDTKLVLNCLYRNTIANYEEVLEKDLSEFTHEDVINMLNSLGTNSRSRKSDILSFVNQYCTWCISEGKSSINPTLGLNRSEIIKVNARALKNKLYTKDEVYEIVETMMLNAGENIFTALTLLLPRYGIMGNKSVDIFNLKEENIYREELKIRYDYSTKDGKIYTKEFDIDEKLIEYIDQAIATDCYKSPMHSEIIYYTGGKEKYLIKYREDSHKDRETREYIYNRLVYTSKRMNKAYKEQGLDEKFIRPVMSDYYNSFKIEKLLEIRRKKPLTNSDLVQLEKQLDANSTVGKYHRLANLYEDATGDRVYPSSVVKPICQRGDKRSDETKDLRDEYERRIIEENHVETVNKILKNIGWK